VIPAIPLGERRYPSVRARMPKPQGRRDNTLDSYVRRALPGRQSAAPAISVFIAAEWPKILQLALLELPRAHFQKPYACDRPAVDNHVDRPAQLDTLVLISGIWYKPVKRRSHVPPHPVEPCARNERGRLRWTPIVGQPERSPKV
jgi:hypothetical protein